MFFIAAYSRKYYNSENKQSLLSQTVHRHRPLTETVKYFKGVFV